MYKIIVLLSVTLIFVACGNTDTESDTILQEETDRSSPVIAPSRVVEESSINSLID